MAPWYVSKKQLNSLDNSITLYSVGISKTRNKYVELINKKIHSFIYLFLYFFVNNTCIDYECHNQNTFKGEVESKELLKYNFLKMSMCILFNIIIKCPLQWGSLDAKFSFVAPLKITD